VALLGSLVVRLSHRRRREEEEETPRLGELISSS
jgi:hypothetical protein